MCGFVLTFYRYSFVTGAVAKNNGEDIYEDGDMASFLKLREHQSSYIAFIETFTTSVTGVAGWKNFKQQVQQIVSRNNIDFDSLLTVSDEAFIVLCVVNYRERWYEETKGTTSVENLPVRDLCCYV